jgi:hypothetical protein
MLWRVGCLQAPFMHFLSINAHRRRSANAEANAITPNRGHDYPDLLADYDFFTDSPREH